MNDCLKIIVDEAQNWEEERIKFRKMGDVSSEEHCVWAITALRSVHTKIIKMEEEHKRQIKEWYERQDLLRQQVQENNRLWWVGVERQ